MNEKDARKRIAEVAIQISDRECFHPYKGRRKIREAMQWAYRAGYDQALIGAAEVPARVRKAKREKR